MAKGSYTSTPILNINSLFATINEIELKDINGNLTGIKLKVVGRDSKQAKDAQHKLMPFLGKTNKDLSKEEMDALMAVRAEITTAFIVGWDNDEAFGGAYSPEFAKELFSKPEAGFVLEQIEEYAQERANFFRSSKK